MSKITIKDVAKKAGVAPSTVSNALNPTSKKISNTSRQRILEIVDDMGYVPNYNAQNIASKNIRRVGLFVRKSGNYKAMQVSEMFIHYINKFAYEERLDLVNIIIPSNSDDYASEVVNKIKKYDISDLIIYGLEKNYDMINTLINLDINKVFIEIPVSGENSHFVSIDNYKAQKDLITKVYTENKITQGLYITGDLYTHIGEERYNAVRNFAKKNNEDIEIIESSFSDNVTFELLKKVDLSKYDYIGCASDDMLSEVAKHLKRYSIYPILSGFDNTYILDNLNYKIYTVEQNVETLSAIIIKMFIDNSYSSVLYDGEIIVKNNLDI